MRGSFDDQSLFGTIHMMLAPFAAFFLLAAGVRLLVPRGRRFSRTRTMRALAERAGRNTR